MIITRGLVTKMMVQPCSCNKKNGIPLCILMKGTLRSITKEFYEAKCRTLHRILPSYNKGRKIRIYMFT